MLRPIEVAIACPEREAELWAIVEDPSLHGQWSAVRLRWSVCVGRRAARGAGQTHRRRGPGVGFAERDPVRDAA